MIMYRRGLILLNHLFLLISIFTLKSDATTSLTHILRQLAAAQSRPLPNPQLPLQISPSPSPSPAPVAPAPVYLPKTEQPVTKPNKEPIVAKTCDKLSKKCHLKMVTACLGFEGSLLLVLNEADISLKVNVTVLPDNITYKDIEIPRHQAKKQDLCNLPSAHLLYERYALSSKYVWLLARMVVREFDSSSDLVAFTFLYQINISDSVRGSSSIVLHAVNENCIIHMGAVVPKDNINPQFPTLETYLTPINGAYVLFASVLIIGGTFTCFKSWKGRHTRVDGIPYQELEMSQSDLVSSANVENEEGWDQRWDDDWDEEKGVKLASGIPGRHSTGNGNISRASSDGWRNDWDD